MSLLPKLLWLQARAAQKAESGSNSPTSAECKVPSQAAAALGGEGALGNGKLLVGVGTVAAMALPQAAESVFLAPPLLPPMSGGLAGAGAGAGAGTVATTGAAALLAQVTGFLAAVFPRSTGGVQEWSPEGCENLKFKLDSAAGMLTLYALDAGGKWVAQGSQSILHTPPNASTETPGVPLPPLTIPGRQADDGWSFRPIEGAPIQTARPDIYATPAYESPKLWTTQTPAQPGGVGGVTVMASEGLPSELPGLEGLPRIEDQPNLFDGGLIDEDVTVKLRTSFNRVVDTHDERYRGYKEGVAWLASPDGKTVKEFRLPHRQTFDYADGYELFLLRSELGDALRDAVDRGEALVQFGFRVKGSGQEVKLGHPERLPIQRP